MSNLGILRILGILGWKTKSKNAPAQQDSEISILKVDAENTLPQRDSRMSNFDVESKSHLPQRDSEISILKTRPLCPYCPLAFKNTPDQQDSNISNLEMGVLGILRSLGILGLKTKNKNRPAQRDSRISNLGLEFENTPAQQDSRMSNLRMGLIVPMGPIGLIGKNPVIKKPPARRNSGNYKLGTGEHGHTDGAEIKKDGIFTMQIKNIMGCFRGKPGNGSMSKRQNTLPQRYSKMSILKIET